MKKLAKSSLSLILILSILSFVFNNSYAQQTPPIMERGLYVDDFMRFNLSGELMPEASILGVDIQKDGIFEKEDELLEYARDNHFSILTLYETEPAFSNTVYSSWNANSKRMETMQEHLCRFINRAKSDFCIKEIYAAVSSSGEGQTLSEYNEQFKIPTPAFELTPEELAYASTRLKLLVESYPESHPMHYPSEIAKFALRVAHFQSCTSSDSKFDGVSTEYEFWNSNNNIGFEELMTDLDDIKFSFLSATTGRHFYINVYYGKKAVSQTASSEIAFLDGTASTKRMADRIFFESYSQSPFSTSSGLPTRKENYFGEDISTPPTAGELETKPNTLISTIFAAEARRNGSTNDFQGKWMENYETGDQVNNIFECEKQNFLNWINASNTKKGDNQMFPGAYQWFSSSYLLKSFKNQPLFYVEYPNACTAQTNYKIMYKGPTESGLNLQFVLSGPVSVTVNTNSPDIALTPDLFFIDQVLPVGTYTATLTIANSCGSGGKTYSETFEVLATTTPQIIAIGHQEAIITVCDGEKIILKAPAGYSYQWTKNTIDLNDDEAITQFYPVTETGLYNCRLTCSGSTSSVNDIDVRMKYNPYVSITASPSGAHNYNLIAEVANVRNGTSLTNCSGMLKYEWTTGETGNNITVDGRIAKKYSLTVSNTEPLNNCKSSNSINVRGNDGIPSLFTLTPSVTSCSGSLGLTTLTLDVIDPLSDPWTSDLITKGVITDGAIVKYITWYSHSYIVLENLDPGRYIATATIDGVAPTVATPTTPFLPTTFDVGTPFPSSPIGTVNISPATCKGGVTGSVSFTLSGTGDYTVTLIGSPQKQTFSLLGTSITVNFTGLPAGHYGLKVNSGCNFEYQDNIIVSEPAGLTINPNPTAPSVPCYSPGTDVNFSLGIGGGTPPYTYSWSPATIPSTPPFHGTPGTYTCTITSSNSCSEKFTYTISQGDALKITSLCSEDGDTHLLVYGGSPITNGVYTLSPTLTFTAVNGKPGEYTATPGPGTYIVTATDDVGCTSSATSISIPVSAVTTADAGDDQVICGNQDMNVFLDANAPVLGIGTWSIILGNGGIISRPHSPTSLFTGVRGESYLLRWTITDATGCSSFDNVKITFHESTLPTQASAGNDQIICGPNAILAANIPVVGTGKWTILNGGSLDYPDSPNAIFTGESDNINDYYYTLRWTITNGDCPSSDEIIIRSARTANPANAGPDQTIACGVTPSKTPMQASLSGSHTGAWSIISGTGGSFNTITNPTTMFTGTIGQTYLLRWTLTRTSTGCTSSDDVVIKFSPVVTADAGPDQILCNQTFATLNATATANAGEGVWSIISGGSGNFSSNTNPYATFTGTAGSNYILRWTITPTGGCGSVVTDDVTIEFPLNLVSESHAGMDQRLCGVTNTSLNANAPTGSETGAWSTISGTNGIITAVSSPQSSFTGTIGTIYVLRWTLSNGGCESIDDVVIDLSQYPTGSSNAGSDQLFLCGTTSASLSANTPTGSNTGKWTIKSGGLGTFLDETNPNTTFTGTAGNLYTLQWEISNLWCSLTDEVAISLNQNPSVAMAGPDQTTCDNNVILDANNPVVGTGVWTILAGSPNTSSSQFNNDAYSKATFTPTTTGVYQLRWTISNSPCTAISDDITITINPHPSNASAGPDQLNLCGLSSTNLAANAPLVGTGTWTVLSGVGGGFTPNVNDPAANFTGNVGSSYTLKWTISNGLCDDKTDNVVISFPNSISANAGTDQNVCTSNSVNLSANSAGSGTGQWSIVSGSGTFANPANNLTTVSNLGTGINVFEWKITSCNTSTDNVTITGFAAPAAPSNSAGPDQLICAGNATLTALTPTIGTGQWTVPLGAGTVTSPFASNSAVTGLSLGINKFRWNIINGPCNQLLDEVIITVTEPANAGPDQTGLCGVSSATLSANTPIVGAGTWTIISGAGGSFTPNANDPAASFNGILGSTYTLRWSTPSTSAACATTDDMVITFNNVPSITIANAGKDQLICGGSTNATLVADPAPAAGETGQWSVFSGTGGSFIGSTSNATATFDGVPGTYVLRWTISNSPCASTSDDITIIFNNNSVPLPISSSVTGTYYVGTSFSLSTLPGNTMAISGSTITFAPGVNITVPSGKTLTINSSILRACGTDMWGGIIVETGGTLNIDQNSKIEDAEIGADFKPGSTCFIRNSTFNRCYSSVSMLGAVSAPWLFTNVKFLSNDFSGQPTNLFTPHLTERASGLNLTNTSIYMVGNNQTEFRNLRKALTSNNTSNVIVSVKSCKFENIHDDLFLNASNAIDISKGTLQVSRSNFSYCETAVHAIDCGVTVDYSNFTKLNTAISVIHPENKSVNIFSNTMTCRRSGIDLLLMESAYRGSVIGNSIIAGDILNATGINSYGIQYSSSSSTYHDSRIGGNLSYNSITLLSMGEAIGLNYKAGMIVSNNFINMQNSGLSVDQQGVKSLNCGHVAASCNYVSGDDNTIGGNQTAMSFTTASPTDPRVSCNTVRNSNMGMVFWGNHGEVNLKHNLFDKDYAGLRLNASTFVGEQEHKGNVWFGSYSGTLAAENLSFVPSQRIKVNTNNLLLVGTYTPACLPSSWFVPDNTADEADCSFQYHDIQINECTEVLLPLGEEEARLRPTDIPAIEDELVLTDFREQIRYTTLEELYARLNENPDLLTSNLTYAEFYDEMQNSNIERFDEIERTQVNADAAILTLIHNIQRRDSIIQWHLGQIAFNDSIGDSTHLALNVSHRSNVETVQQEIDIFNQLLETGEYPRILQARLLNEDIEINNQIENNTRIINEIRLSAIESKDFEFSQETLQEISEIAHQCPLAGGNSVSAARGLYALSHPNEYYDDKNACLAQGYFRMAKPEKSSKSILSYFSVSPNPASDVLSIHYYISTDEEVQMIIYNSLQQKVKSVTLPSEEKDYQINCSDLPSGVYLYSVKSKDGIQHQGKVSILNQ